MFPAGGDTPRYRDIGGRGSVPASLEGFVRLLTRISVFFRPLAVAVFVVLLVLVLTRRISLEDTTGYVAFVIMPLVLARHYLERRDSRDKDAS